MDFIVRQKSFWGSDDESVLRAIHEGFVQTHQAMWKELGECSRPSHLRALTIDEILSYLQKLGPRPHPVYRAQPGPPLLSHLSAAARYTSVTSEILPSFSASDPRKVPEAIIPPGNNWSQLITLK